MGGGNWASRADHSASCGSDNHSGMENTHLQRMEFLATVRFVSMPVPISSSVEANAP